jgi:hypothetical protein
MVSALSTSPHSTTILRRSGTTHAEEVRSTLGLCRCSITSRPDNIRVVGYFRLYMFDNIQDSGQHKYWKISDMPMSAKLWATFSFWGCSKSRAGCSFTALIHPPIFIRSISHSLLKQSREMLGIFKTQFKGNVVYSFAGVKYLVFCKVNYFVLDIFLRGFPGFLLDQIAEIVG